MQCKHCGHELGENDKFCRNCGQKVEEIVLEKAVDENEFVLDTRELKNILGEVPLDSPEVVEWIRDYIKENEENLYGGVQK